MAENVARYDEFFILYLFLSYLILFFIIITFLWQIIRHVIINFLFCICFYLILFYLSLLLLFFFYQVLLIVILIFLLMDVSESRFRYRTKRHRNFRSRGRGTIRKTKPTRFKTTSAPLPSNRVIRQDECRVIVDKLPKKRPPGPICLRMSETQKLAMLREVGGYIPRYMALNRKHAEKFEDLTLDRLPLPSNVSSSQTSGSVPIGKQSDVRSKRMVDDSETFIQQCRVAGVDPQIGLLRLCTECSALTALPPNVFPPFINEVVCNFGLPPAVNGPDCFNRIGFCQQGVIRFNFLRSTGEYEQDDDDDDVFIEELETFEQDIRTCCQCRAFTFIGLG